GGLRSRVPIDARWRGVVARPEPWVARVTYVGEATIIIDPDRPESRVVTALPSRYGAEAVAFVPMPGGRHTLDVTYRFDDGSTWGGPPPAGPWATLRLERGRGQGGQAPGAPVTAVRPRGPRRAAARAGGAAGPFLRPSLLPLS